MILDMVNLSTPAWTPKKPIRKWFHMTWKCLELCIPILGGLPEYTDHGGGDGGLGWTR